jgi:hypothetical protein
MVQPSVTVIIKKNEFKKKANAYPGKVSRIVRKTAFDILADANTETPYDTGFLAGSASISVADTQASIHWAAFYAMYQEFGTRYIAPVLFATRAADRHRPLFIAALETLEV